MNCHCDAVLVPHEGTGAKQGALHCYECGCCYLSDGKTPRPGVPVCSRAPAAKEERAKPINQMNKAELLAAIAETGRRVGEDDYTVPQLRDLLSGTPAQDIIAQEANEADAPVDSQAPAEEAAPVEPESTPVVSDDDSSGTRSGNRGRRG